MNADVDSDMAMRRERLERLIAAREAAITARLKSLKADIDARLDVGEALRRNALPIAGIALGAGFLLGSVVALRRSARRKQTPVTPQMQMPQTPSARPSSPTFFNQLAQTALNSAKSLALNYAADFATRKLQDWLAATMTQRAQSKPESQNRIKP